MDEKSLVVMTGDFYVLFRSYAPTYATAQDTPRAVPIAANTAEARFHRNFISLDLFSLVITLIL